MDEHIPDSDARPASGRSGVLDSGTRWLRAIAERRGAAPLGEHGHWDRVRRDWRYHTHDSEAKRAY